MIIFAISIAFSLFVVCLLALPFLWKKTLTFPEKSLSSAKPSLKERQAHLLDAFNKNEKAYFEGAINYELWRQKRSNYIDRFISISDRLEWLNHEK